MFAYHYKRKKLIDMVVTDADHTEDKWGQG